MRQSWQRKGAASAAIRALTEYAWTELDVQRLEIVVAVGNDASLNAARKAGAVDEGIARKRLKLGRQWVDAHMLSLVKP